LRAKARGLRHSVNIRLEKPPGVVIGPDGQVEDG
jgi:hypothetical protein